MLRLHSSAEQPSTDNTNPRAERTRFRSTSYKALFAIHCFLANLLLGLFQSFRPYEFWRL